MEENFKSYLQDVPSDKRFWCHDGKVLSNLRELLEHLQVMTDETYLYHANGERNDFSAWIYDVIGDVSLAKNLLSSKDRKDAISKIKRRINYLSKKISNA